MARFRCYIKPFDDNGNYQPDWIEVTSDIMMDRMSSLSLKLDNDEFSVGIFKPNDMAVYLRNDHGKYSAPSVVQSIFRFKRNESLFRITWQLEDEEPICGVAVADDAFLSPEVEVFKGLISDKSSKISVGEQNLNLTVLSRESIFERVETPYASLSNGDNLSDVIKTVLNQTEITAVLNYDPANITVGLDQAIDTRAPWEDTTVKEVLDDALAASNSVLYISGDDIIVAPRTEGATSAITFFGQASDSGNENIMDIKNITSGYNQLFNFWKWEDVALTSEDAESITIHGVYKKEVEYGIFTNTSKRQNILNALRDRYKEPLQKLELVTPVKYAIWDLKILDKVLIDYPTVLYPSEADSLPILGDADYSDTFFPSAEFTLTLSKDEESFKILGYKIDFKRQVITFNMEQNAS